MHSILINIQMSRRMNTWVLTTGS